MPLELNKEGSFLDMIGKNYLKNSNVNNQSIVLNLVMMVQYWQLQVKTKVFIFFIDNKDSILNLLPNSKLLRMSILLVLTLLSIINL